MTREIKKMKKITLALGLLASAVFAHAADPLNGTVWKTIDDQTKQPKALVKFTEQKDGSLSASIQSVLTPGEENSCKKCEGTYHNKSLKGVTIVNGLKNVNGAYEGGTILDPKSGKTYKLKGKIAEGGKKLELRGFVGVAALGRNQTWVRAN
jgi:uncharacterized protein (DUF2147 family)